MGTVIIGGATVIALVFAMTGLGTPLLSALGFRLRAIERRLAAPLVGALPLSAMVWVVGYIRYDAAAMGGVLAVACAASFVLLRNNDKWWKIDDGVLRALAADPPSRFILVALALVVIVAVVSSFAPPSDVDTIRYHLTLPRRDLEFGRIQAHYGWSVYEFFPPLVGLLVRLAYALGGASAAQLLNVALTVLAGAWSAALAMRLGGTARIGLLAALLYLSQRVVINLAAAVTADTTLTGCVTAAACVVIAIAADDDAGPREGVLLGLLLGAALNTKYHAAVVVAELIGGLLVLALVRRRGIESVLAASVTIGVLIAPMLIRNAVITGNPVFPLLQPLFDSAKADIFVAFKDAMVSQQTVSGGFALAPLTMFIRQGDYDGLQFGFPIILIFVPFAFGGRYHRPRLVCLGLWLAFVAAWWVGMPHLLRFTQPVLGIAAALAAVGLAAVAEAVAALWWGRAVLKGLLLTAAVIQSLFLGSSALYRVPAALGLVTVEQMMEAPQFRYYGLISPCLWLERHLQPGERYLALTNDPSFHCPQAAAMSILAPDEVNGYYSRAGATILSPAELAHRMAEQNVRYILFAHNLGSDADPLVFAKHRFDEMVMPLLAGLVPMMQSSSGLVYGSDTVIARLKTH